MTATIIEAHDMVKRFNFFTAVDHISFAVPRGVIFGFPGPNRAGRTMTLKMLATVLSPANGHLSVAGHHPVHQPRSSISATASASRNASTRLRRAKVRMR